MKKITFLFISLLLFFSCKNQNCQTEILCADLLGQPNSKKMMRSSFSNDSYESSFEYANLNENFPRKLIKTGNLEIQVYSLSEAESYFVSWIKEQGGYISLSEKSENYLNIQAKIPSSKFDDVISNANDFGKVLNYSVTCDDVSDQFYDLKSRLENKKLMKANLEKYLKDAKDIKDLLQIEKELNNVVSEIDSMQGRFNRLENQIEFSSVNVNFSLPKTKVKHSLNLPDLPEAFNNFVSLILGFFAKFFFVFLLILIITPFLVLASAFIFYITFGKIGLVRKLFEKLKK